MTKQLIILLSAFLLLSSSTSVSDPTLDNATIIRWSGLTAEDKVEKVVPLSLKGGEQAYLAQILRFRGRNDMYGMYLIRPRLAQAREILSSVHSFDSVPGGDAPTLIVTETGASGQGDEYYTKSILYFKEWQPTVLYEVNYGKSDACVNFPSLKKPCYEHNVKWEFQIDKGTIKLVETVYYKSGKARGTKTVKIYTINGISLSLKSTKKYKE